MAPPTLSCVRCIISKSTGIESRRMFASTPINAVLRCQETFPMPKPEIDKTGRPRYRQATIDKSETRGGRQRHNDDWSGSSQFGDKRGEGPRQFSRSGSGGFERKEGSRPFGKKGGYGLKSSTDGPQAAEGSGGRDHFVRNSTREEQPRFEGERGFGGRTPSARDRPRDRYVKQGDRNGSRGISDGGRDWVGRTYDNGRHGHKGLANTKTGDRQQIDSERENQPWRPREGDSRRDLSTETPTRPWEPAKKLTFQAMAGLRALHANDPEKFDRDTLSERYGISYDAVTRILRSQYQDRKGAESGEKIQGTKWDMNPATSRLSPVPAVKRAFGAGGREGGFERRGR